MNDRHFVVHNYHDHANDTDQHEEVDQEDPNQRRRGGVSVAFPVKLMPSWTRSKPMVSLVSRGRPTDAAL
jgi:hypothetical protein